MHTAFLCKVLGRMAKYCGEEWIYLNLMRCSLFGVASESAATGVTKKETRKVFFLMFSIKA